MNKIKLVCTISIITIIGGTLFGCNNQSSKQTVNDTSNSMISDSDSSKLQQIVDDTKANEDIKTTDIPDVVSKVEGRRNEYIERLDNIQKKLDELPEKKNADEGMLKEELSPEIMNDLEIKQLKWIEEKEGKAREEEAKFKGGTFEPVAGYIVLYEATKEKCYELVNQYMTD